MKSNLPTIVIIIIFSLAHSSCLLSQEQITFRDYKCTITNKQIRIDEYIGNSIVVSIPDSIDGCVVTEIGENAFGSKNILQISIPSTISHIKYGAFQMNQIENIEVPESVKFIGNNILRGNRIKTAKFPEYYQGSIADQFLDNSGIRFNDFEYIIFNEKAVISKYFGSETDIILPSNIEGYPVLAIGAYAFRKKKLNSVVFPKSTIDIGSYAFEGNNLVELNLPKLKRIGDSSFANNKIKKLVLPESILDIGDAAFMNNEISELNLLTKINLIRQQTFENNKLTKLKLPESLNMIEGNAFSRNNLKLIDFPSSSINIEYGAFSSNDFYQITIPASVICEPENVFSFSKINKEDNFFYIIYNEKIMITGYDKYTFDLVIPSKLKGYDVCYIGASAFSFLFLEKVSIPNTIEYIGYDSFRSNKLISITLPDKIRRIGYGAFLENQLNSVQLPSSITRLGYRAFGKNNFTTIKLPYSDQNKTYFWTNTFNQTFQSGDEVNVDNILYRQ